MNWFNNLLESWKAYYYSEPFEIVCLIVALTTGFMYAKRTTINILFLIYAASGLLGMLYEFYLKGIVQPGPERVSMHISVLNMIVSYIEMFVFMFFFYKTLSSKAIHAIIKFFVISLTIVNAVIFLQVCMNNISVAQLRKISSLLIAFQLLPLLFICFAYYYHILNSDPGVDLFKRPSFWITTSLFFYILLLVPFVLLYDNLRNTHQDLIKVFFTIHFFGFGSIFIALSNAFICRKLITT